MYPKQRIQKKATSDVRYVEQLETELDLPYLTTWPFPLAASTALPLRRLLPGLCCVL
jgi:hypothetical protein